MLTPSDVGREFLTTYAATLTLTYSLAFRYHADTILPHKLLDCECDL